jgi:DNA-binding NarL/FixJ family response regulator
MSLTLSPDTPLSILIVDDHPLVRRGLANIISQEKDLKVCGESASMPDAIKQLRELAPQLVIIDISLKEGNGLELIKHIRSSHPDVKMLVCSMHDESLFAERCLRAGANGYLNKEAASERVVEAIRAIATGKPFLSEELAERLLARVVGGEDPLERSPIESLTDRELEVFGLIGEGLTTRQIAERLHLSHKTIESYRENIKTKLGLKNAAELSRHAVQWVMENG